MPTRGSDRNVTIVAVAALSSKNSGVFTNHPSHVKRVSTVKSNNTSHLHVCKVEIQKTYNQPIPLVLLMARRGGCESIPLLPFLTLIHPLPYPPLARWLAVHLLNGCTTPHLPRISPRPFHGACVFNQSCANGLASRRRAPCGGCSPVCKSCNG